MFTRSAVPALTAGLLILTACSTAGTDAAAPDPTDPPATTIAEPAPADNTDGPVDEPADTLKPADEPAEQPADAPVEEPAEEPAEEPLPIGTGTLDDPYLPGYRHTITDHGDTWEFTVTGPGEDITALATRPDDVQPGTYLYGFPVEIVLVDAPSGTGTAAPYFWSAVDVAADTVSSPMMQFSAFPCDSVPNALQQTEYQMLPGATLTGIACFEVPDGTINPLFSLDPMGATPVLAAGTFDHDIAPSSNATFPSGVNIDGTGDPGSMNNPMPIGEPLAVQVNASDWEITVTGPAENITSSIPADVLAAVLPDFNADTRAIIGVPVDLTVTKAGIVGASAMDLFHVMRAVTMNNGQMASPSGVCDTFGTTDIYDLADGTTISTLLCFDIPGFGPVPLLTIQPDLSASLRYFDT